MSCVTFTVEWIPLHCCHIEETYVHFLLSNISQECYTWSWLAINGICKMITRLFLQFKWCIPFLIYHLYIICVGMYNCTLWMVQTKKKVWHCPMITNDTWHVKWCKKSMWNQYIAKLLIIQKKNVLSNMFIQFNLRHCQVPG